MSNFSSNNTEPNKPTRQRAFSIDEFCKRYGVGRTKAYEEIQAGRLRACKAGRRTIITEEAAEKWLQELPLVTAGQAA